MVWRWEIWTDAARTGGEEGKKGAEEDGGDHQRLSAAFSESLSSLLTSYQEIKPNGTSMFVETRQGGYPVYAPRYLGATKVTNPNCRMDGKPCFHWQQGDNLVRKM